MTANAGPIVLESKDPGLLIRLIYFVLVGWWIGALVSGIAWLLVIKVIGLPFGLWLVNHLPTVITPRPPEQSWRQEGLEPVLDDVPQDSTFVARVPAEAPPCLGVEEQRIGPTAGRRGDLLDARHCVTTPSTEAPPGRRVRATAGADRRMDTEGEKSPCLSCS